MDRKPAHSSIRDIDDTIVGFTLIELMVATAIAVFIILTVLTIADISIRSYRAQERVSDAQQSVRAAMDLMVRDIRMAGYDPMAISHGSTPDIGIIEASETRMQFSADLNADRVDNGGTENLTYFFDSENGRLRQQEGGGAYAQTFIENVSALKFSYLNSDGLPANDLSDIVMVKVTLTVTCRDHKGGMIERTLTTRINCRNLRF